MTSGLGHSQTQNGSTSFAEVFPAKIFPTPDEVPELKDQEAGCSLKPFAWFANYDRGLLCWRTWQRCLLEGWTEFSGRWPRSGMMRNGIVYRLPPLVPRISGTGFSFWVTPTATDGMRGGKPARPHDTGVPLSQQVVMPHRWPTPRSADARRGPDYGATANHQGGGNLLGAVKTCDKVSGQLNPTWVEWLMGFPVGWTDLEDLETQSFHKLQNGSDSE